MVTGPADSSLSAIVIGHNHADCLDRCLDSLLQQQGLPALDVIYIDNASSDGSAGIAEERLGRPVVRNAINTGFARAVNQGLTLARGRYLALVNPDTHLPPHTLRRLVGALGEDPRLGLVGATLIGEDGQEQGPLAPFPTPLALLARHLGLTARHRGWITGALVVLEAALLRELGGLEERFFLYGEDMDLCHRIQRLGLETRVEPGVAVHHRGNPCWSPDRLIRVYGAYLRFAGLRYRRPRRLSLGLGLSLLWLTRSVAWRQTPGAFFSGLARMWSMEPDLPTPRQPR